MTLHLIKSEISIMDRPPGDLHLATYLLYKLKYYNLFEP